MRSKALFALAVTAALVLVAAWQSVDPAPATAPRISAQVSNVLAASSPPPGTEHEREGVSLRAPAPQPPEVTNDPLKGEVWLRVIDAETNLPLANTECEMWAVSGDDEYDYELLGNTASVQHWRESNVPFSPRVTDALGCLRLSARIDTQPMAAPLAEEEVNPATPPPESSLPAVEAHWRPEHARMLVRYPVPSGWQGYTPLQELGKELFALATTPRTSPVDVLVKRNPKLSGRVSDRDGAPVAEMSVYAFPVYAPPQVDGWARFATDAYFVVQTYSGRSGDEGPTSSTGEAESELLAELRSYIENPWLDQGEFLPHIGARTMWSSPATRGLRHHTKSDSSGRFELKGLHDGTWIVACYSRFHKMTHTRVEVGKANQSVDLVAGQPSMGAAEFTVAVAGTTEARVQVSLRHLIAPWLLSKIKPRTEIWSELMVDSSGQAFAVGGLEAGLWELRWESDANAHSTTLLVEPRRVTRAELEIGANAHGTWKPVVRFDGMVIPGVPLYLHGGDHDHPERILPDISEDGEDSQAMDLGSGAYTAWVDGLPPLSFSLACGEARTDFFDLPVAIASVSIDATFARAISRDSTPDFGLARMGPFADGPALSFASAGSRENDEPIDKVSPQKPVIWRVPAGEYRWSLTGYEYNVSGTVVLRPGLNNVHFSMDKLPGLARLEVLAPESTEENPIDLRVIAADTEGARMSAAKDNWGIISSRANTNLAPDPALTLPFDHGKRWLVWAPAGQFRVFASRNGGYCEQVVNVPGRTTLTLNRKFNDRAAKVKLLRDADSSFSFSGVIYTADGLHEMARFGFEESFAPGLIRLLIGRERWIEGESEEHRKETSYATTEVMLKPGETSELNVSHLNYVAAARVTIRCRGRGDPGASFDPWWSGLEDTEPSLRALVSLDRAGPGAHTYIELDTPDEVLPASRVEFAYLGRTLPPGRYRAIPWEGAPEKYCRTFELKPGQHEEVLIDTSR